MTALNKLLAIKQPFNGTTPFDPLFSTMSLSDYNRLCKESPDSVAGKFVLFTNHQGSRSARLIRYMVQETLKTLYEKGHDTAAKHIEDKFRNRTHFVGIDLTTSERHTDPVYPTFRPKINGKADTRIPVLVLKSKSSSSSSGYLSGSAAVTTLDVIATLRAQFLNLTHDKNAEDIIKQAMTFDREDPVIKACVDTHDKSNWPVIQADAKVPENNDRFVSLWKQFAQTLGDYENSQGVKRAFIAITVSGIDRLKTLDENPGLKDALEADPDISKLVSWASRVLNEPGTALEMSHQKNCRHTSVSEPAATRAASLPAPLGTGRFGVRSFSYWSKVPSVSFPSQSTSYLVRYSSENFTGLDILGRESSREFSSLPAARQSVTIVPTVAQQSVRLISNRAARMVLCGLRFLKP